MLNRVFVGSVGDGLVTGQPKGAKATSGGIEGDLPRYLIQKLTGQTSDSEGTQGNWAPCNAFSVEECGVVVELLTLPSLAVIRTFQYL